jgi:hypothetical protein
MGQKAIKIVMDWEQTDASKVKKLVRPGLETAADSRLL